MTETESQSPIALSVVIPCYNAEATLSEQLDALLAERWREPWEIIVCDNGSTDGSRDIIRRYVQQDSRVRYISAPENKGPSYARNKGVEHARGELIGFVDADDVIAEGWVEAIANGIRTHRFVASKMKPYSLNQKNTYESKPMRQEVGLIPYGYVPFYSFAGACGLGVERLIHNKIGGFDRSLLYCEDCDYCWRIQQLGIPLVFQETAIIYIRQRTSLVDRLRQSKNWGEYHALLIKKHQPNGIPRVSYRHGFVIWWKSLKQIKGICNKRKREVFLLRLAHRMGMLKGSIKYRVFAP